MRNELGTMKEHYKSYKAGKHWVFACITVVSLGLGLVGAGTTAQADDVSGNDASSSNVQLASNLQDKQQVLKTATSSSAAGENDVQNGSGSDVDPDNPVDNTNDATNSDQEKDNTGAPQSDADVNAGQDKDNVNDESAPQAPVDDQSGQADDVDDDTPDTVKDESPESNVAGNTDNTTDKIDETGDTDKMAVNDLNTPATYGPARLARTSLMKTATSSIDGVDASVWMPDANLRAWVEGYLSSNWRMTINDANLSQYVKKVTALSDGYGATISHPTAIYAGAIQSFEGLQYFTNLTSFIYYSGLPGDKTIDFSFAPDLTTLTITNSNGSAQNVDAATVLQGISSNVALQSLTLTNCGLTGQLPSLAQYTNLKFLNLSNNALAGDLSNVGTLPQLTSLNISYNQIIGALPDLATLPKLSYLEASENELAALPDMSGYTGYLDVANNALTNGLQNPGMSNIGAQEVTGKEYTITPTVRSFDPITDVLQGVQGSDGQIDLADPMVQYNLGTPGDIYLTVAPDPDNAVGFLLVAGDDTPDGTYKIGVWNQKTHMYNVTLTFTIKNGEDPVVPDPDTTDPDTDTTNPGGTTTPDTTNPDTTPTTPDTPTPDTPVTGGDADEVVAPTTDDSATPLTGGDGATIDTPTPAAKTTIQSAGQADRVVKNTTKRNGQPVSLVAKNSARVVRGTKAPVAHQPAAASRLAAKWTATPTTLPQTNEQNSAELIAAGVAVALATLGMGVKVRRH